MINYFTMRGKLLYTPLVVTDPQTKKPSLSFVLSGKSTEQTDLTMQFFARGQLAVDLLENQFFCKGAQAIVSGSLQQRPMDGYTPADREYYCVAKQVREIIALDPVKSATEPSPRKFYFNEQEMQEKLLAVSRAEYERKQAEEAYKNSWIYTYDVLEGITPPPPFPDLDIPEEELEPPPPGEPLDYSDHL